MKLLTNQYLVLLFLSFSFFLFLPSLIFVVGQQSSYATGILLTSVVIILFLNSIFGYIVITRPLVYLYILILILFHSLIVYIFFYEIDLKRILGTLAIFSILIFAIFSFLKLIYLTPDNYFKITVVNLFYVLIFLGILDAAFGITPFNQYSALGKPIFPFMEPSHFAIIISPFYLFYNFIDNSNWRKVISLLLGIIFLLFVSNLTFLVVLILPFTFKFNRRNFFLLFPLFVIMMFSLFFLINSDFSEYYLNRISFNNNNLSTLVWLQGWEESYYNMHSTNFVGIGFQQLGVKPPVGEYGNLIFDIIGYYLNRYDGGTFGSKLLSEFGLIGAFLIFYFITAIYKSYRSIKFDRSNLESKSIFFHCCIFSFIIELFVRSTSYLGPGFLMFLIGYIGIGSLKYNLLKSWRRN